MLSFISFVAYLWVDLVVPCCASDRKEKAYDGLVIPLLHGDSGEGGGCCGGRRKKRRGGQSPVINLIVPNLDTLNRSAGNVRSSKPRPRSSAPSRRSAPTTLASLHRDEWDEASSDDGDDDAATEKSTRPLRPAAPMRPLSSGARRRIKRRIILDVLATLAWFGIVGWAVGFGKSCPPGTGSGWYVHDRRSS